MERISEHISIAEATHSDRAIQLGLDNTPNEAQLVCMKIVADYCFEPIRKWWDKPLKINSFFRSVVVNKANNGVATSQHCKGEAIDFTAGNKEDNKKIFDWAKANLKFDQLIWENDGQWLHISYSMAGNRNMAFNAKQVIPK